MFTKIISNLLIWMCIREIIFIKRENRTLFSNAFLISCVWSLNSISLRLSNSLIYVSVQLPIFMHPLTGWTSFLLYNHPRWTRYMFCIQIDKIKCISFSLSLQIKFISKESNFLNEWAEHLKCRCRNDLKCIYASKHIKT